MRIERTKDEILIRLSADMDVTELQNLIDYIEYKENTASSKATDEDVDESITTPIS